jgi:membrane protein DedA with SNARE-associated domain
MQPIEDARSPHDGASAIFDAAACSKEMDFAHGELPHLISTYGYGAVGGLAALEGIGVPLPAEATLIAASVIAGTAHSLNIWLVVAAAAGGAIFGESIGFWIGREIGYRLLVRYGRYVWLSERRIKLGQYLFLRHGREVVLFGHFLGVLRALAGLLAGTNCMRWTRFLAYNAAGGTVWAAAFGLGAYFLGKEVDRLAKPLGIGVGAAAAIVTIAAAFLVHRHGTELEGKAEAALPGPLRPIRRGKAG